MQLSALAGNGHLKQLLTQREEGRGLSHAYMITGAAGSGRHTLARLLAAAMMCAAAREGARPCGCCGPCKKVLAGIHPDVITVSGGEGKPITVDQVRALRGDAHIRPNEGERKVYILEQADRMNQSAQNAMLKLLEEGPPYAVFLLLAENSGGLLATVRSRCEQLPLAPVAPEACAQWLQGRFPGKSREEIARAAQDCQGLLGRAVQELEGSGGETLALREQANKLCAALVEADELALLEAAMVLDKLGRDELCRLLDQTVVSLAGRLPQAGDKRRILRAVELLRQLRGAAELNANPGQLAGWLCAGMYVEN